jgi:hypothetical protein
LYKKVYLIFQKELHQFNSSNQIDRNHIPIIIGNNIEPQIKNLPEFNSCVEVMAGDEKIKTIMGKVVGTNGFPIIIQNEERCIIILLTEAYFSNTDYDLESFEKVYLSFEDFFNSDSIKLKDTSRLYNFSMEGDELDLGDGVFIRKIGNQNEDPENIIELIDRPDTVFSKSLFVMERYYSRKKIIGNEHDNETRNSAKSSETGDKFEWIIRALRILKSSGVYRDDHIKTDSITFIPSVGYASRTDFSFFENTVIGKKCVIESSEIDRFRLIYNSLNKEVIYSSKKKKDDKDILNRMNIAISRLSFGMERKRIEDKFIDYLIGMEALYLPDGNQELRYRLSLRVAFNLSEKGQRKDTFDFMKRMYDERGHIVHGGKNELTKDDVLKVEELLRKSITLGIFDENVFKTERLDSNFFE